MLDSFIRLVPFIQASSTLRKEILDLVQIGMSIHSGHPEKYKEAITLLEQESETLSED